MAPLTTVWVRVRGDTTALRDDIRVAQATLPAVQLRVTLDTSRLRLALREAARRLPDITVNVRPKLDTSRFRMGEFRDLTFNVRPVLDLTIFRAQWRLFAAVYLRDHIIRIRPDIDEGLIRNAGRRAGGAASSGFGGIFSPAVIGIIVAAVVAAAPAAGAALVAGILLSLGGGVIAAGIASAARDPAVKAAFGKFGEQAKTVFDQIGQSFKAPLISAASTFNVALAQIGPVMAGLSRDMAPIVDKLVPALTQFVVNLLPGIAAGVKASKPLFDALAEKLPPLGTALSDFFTSIAKGAPGATTFIKDFFNFLIFIIPVLGGWLRWLSDRYQNYHDGVVFWLKSIEKAWDATVQAIHQIADGIHRNIIQPLVQAYQAMRTAVDVVAGAIGAAWGRTRDAAVLVWNTVRDVVFAPLGAAYRTLSTGVKAAFDIVGAQWERTRANAASAWNWIRDNVANPIIGMFRDTIPNAFRSAVSSIGAFWDRIRSVVATPVNWVIANVVNRVASVFNDVASKLGLGRPLKQDFGGTGAIQGASFAAGGPVLRAAGGLLRGPGGPRDDKIPAWLSNGEYVIPADKVQQLGVGFFDSIIGRSTTGGNSIGGYQAGGLVAPSLALMNIFNNVAGWVKGQIGNVVDRVPGAGMVRDIAVSMGRKLVAGLVAWAEAHNPFAATQGFLRSVGPGGAGPGFPPWPSSPGASRGDSGVWRSILGLVRASGIPYSFGNAYRAGDPLWHGSGRAVDLMGYNQDRLASFFMGMQSRVLELIHRSNSRDYAVTRGVNRGSFNNALMEAHRNHVHIAMAQGGLVGLTAPLQRFDRGGAWRTGTLGYNASGRTETVSTGTSMDTMAAKLDLLHQDLVVLADAVGHAVGREINGTATTMRQLARAR